MLRSFWVSIFSSSACICSRFRRSRAFDSSTRRAYRGGGCAGRDIRGGFSDGGSHGGLYRFDRLAFHFELRSKLGRFRRRVLVPPLRLLLAPLDHRLNPRIRNMPRGGVKGKARACPPPPHHGIPCGSAFARALAPVRCARPRTRWRGPPARRRLWLLIPPGPRCGPPASAGSRFEAEGSSLAPSL